MYTPIEKLPPTARVWIYQANRTLNSNEMATATEMLQTFCESWAAHGSGLQTSFRIDHKRFLILAVDEQSGGASGCSIDSSVRVVKELGVRLGLDFLDRSEIAFWEDDRVITYPITQIKNLFTEGRLNTQTQTFNTLATTLGEWNNTPLQYVADSWLKRYLPKVSV